MIPMESPLNHPPANGRAPASQTSKDGETQPTLPAGQGADEIGKGFGLLLEGEIPEMERRTSATDVEANTAETTELPSKQRIAPLSLGADSPPTDQTSDASIANEVGEINPPLKPVNEGKEASLPGAIEHMTPVSAGDQARPDLPQRPAPAAGAVPGAPANFQAADIPLSPRMAGAENTTQQPSPLPIATPATVVSPTATKATEIVVTQTGLFPMPTAEKPPPQQRIDVGSQLENALPARRQTTQVEVFAPPVAPPPSPSAKIQSPLDFIKMDGLEPAARHAPEILVPRADFTRAPAQPIQDVRPVVAQLAAAIVKADNGKLDIRLDPPELGRLSVTISGVDDAISAVVAADRAETQDLLRRHADLLQRALRDAGYSEVTLDFSSSSQNSHGDGDGIGQNNNEAAPEPSTASELVIRRSPSSGLDIRL